VGTSERSFTLARFARRRGIDKFFRIGGQGEFLRAGNLKGSARGNFESKNAPLAKRAVRRAGDFRPTRSAARSGCHFWQSPILAANIKILSRCPASSTGEYALKNAFRVHWFTFKRFDQCFPCFFQ
jgi:hypothetical protein